MQSVRAPSPISRLATRADLLVPLCVAALQLLDLYASEDDDLVQAKAILTRCIERRREMSDDKTDWAQRPAKRTRLGLPLPALAAGDDSPGSPEAS